MLNTHHYLPNSCVFVNVYDVTNARRKTQVGNKIVIDVILSRIKVWLHSVLLHPPLNISLRSTNPLRTLCRLITGVCLKKRKTINYHCKPWRMVQYLTTDCLCWDDRAGHWESWFNLCLALVSSGQQWEQWRHWILCHALLLASTSQWHTRLHEKLPPRLSSWLTSQITGSTHSRSWFNHR